MLRPQDVINEFSKALVEGRGAVFVGAGISTPSRVPGWAELLRGMAETRLGIQLNPDDDLPLIAQHIVNRTNNRAPLIDHFRNVLQKPYAHNAYHAILAKTNVKCLWTTNYDTLLEEAFRSHFKVTVRASDESISRGGRVSDIEVIKMHGCIEQSGANDLVVTQEDYDDFFEQRPATAHRLSRLLIYPDPSNGEAFQDVTIRSALPLQLFRCAALTINKAPCSATSISRIEFPETTRYVA